MSDDDLREQVAREIAASVRGRRWGDLREDEARDHDDLERPTDTTKEN